MPKNINNYTNERNIVLQKMYNIIEINDNNKMFSLKLINKIKLLNLKLKLKNIFYVLDGLILAIKNVNLNVIIYHL